MKISLKTCFLACTLFLVSCNHKRAIPIKVCINLATELDNNDAKRGIDWWKENVQYTCDDSEVFIINGEAPSIAPDALGWTSVNTITYVKGPIFQVIRHEFGHILGFSDSEQGVMSCGGQY
jgi:hypothetical protein